MARHFPGRLARRGLEGELPDAHDAGFYLKRARAAEAAYGSQSYHRDRYARIQGY